MPGRRRALLVAVDNYDDPKLPPLSAPSKDAEALADVLGDETLGGFEVDVLSGGETSLAICQQLDELLTGCSKDDVVLLHFGCHGLKDDHGELYLAARNTQSRLLYSTAIDTAAVFRMMRRSPAGSVILLLDCCFGGAFSKGVLARASNDLDLAARVQEGPLSGGRGLAVVTASNAIEWAFEVDASGRRGAPSTSVFTRAVLDGIRSGEADLDQNGKISVSELYSYVYDHVRAGGTSQTPELCEFRLQGDLYISRNPRRRVSAADLPARVRRLIADPENEMRVHGVRDLAGLAAGKTCR